MRQQQGFTLVEMIVAVTIFAVVAVFISELFIITTRAQTRASTSEKIQSDARVLMGQIADRIASSTINYEYYNGNVSGVQEELALVDEYGQEIIIRKSSSDFAQTACASEQSTPCLEISENGGAFYDPMSSENFTVDIVKFFISPSSDPIADSINQQPLVTFALGLQAASVRQEQLGTMYFQTSVSSRVYLR